jgi:hypothetical protein
MLVAERRNDDRVLVLEGTDDEGLSLRTRTEISGDQLTVPEHPKLAVHAAHGSIILSENTGDLPASTLTYRPLSRTLNHPRSYPTHPGVVCGTELCVLPGAPNRSCLRLETDSHSVLLPW